LEGGIPLPKYIDSCSSNSIAKFNDMHVYDVAKNTVSALKATGDIPLFRSCHTATVIGKKIWVFGGSICQGGPYTYYNDTHVFDPGI
jgi:N-acetylneuraminic acid mutarotase